MAKVATTEEAERRVMKLADKLEIENDAIGVTAIRHEISEYIVRIRLLARDGHLRNMNGGEGPDPKFGIPKGYRRG